MNLFKKGLIRGAIPFIIVIITSLLVTHFQGSSAIWNHVFSYGLIAFFLGLTSVIYEVAQWRFLKQIIVHYVAMLVTVFPTLLLSGIYPLNSVEDVVRVYFLFNKTGLFLFVTTYLIFQWRHRAYMKAQNQ